MPSPNSTFTELVSTTFNKHRKEVKDNISNNNALLRRLASKGNTRHEDGGLTIVEPLDYASNTTYQRYSGYDTLNVAASDVISAAQFNWKQIAVNVVASGLEMRINKGDTRIINLVKARIKNAIRTFKNSFSSDIYSDGTATNQIGGLQALVSDLGTGTVGGINSTTFPFWASALQSAAAPLGGGAAITVGPTTIENLFLGLWLNQIRGDDKPDLIVTDTVYFQHYENSQVSLKRYASDGSVGSAAGGFASLKYKTADVVFDGGSGIPASHAYFLNTDYLYLVVHEDADMTVMDEMKPYNQDAAVIPVLWMGNLVVSNRRLQGVAKA